MECGGGGGPLKKKTPTHQGASCLSLLSVLAPSALLALLLFRVRVPGLLYSQGHLYDQVLHQDFSY